jgi:hypothetical protein
MRWTKNPGATDFLERHIGYRSMPWIAEQLTAQGYPVTLQAVELRAHRIRALGREASDELTLADAARLLRIGESSVRYWVRRLGLIRRGSGHFRFLPVQATACLCAHFRIASPYPVAHTYREGQVVAAAVGLRVAHTSEVFLLPVGVSRTSTRGRGDRWDRGDELGAVVSVQPGALVIQLRYGQAVVAPSLVEPAPAPASSRKQSTEGDGE